MADACFWVASVTVGVSLLLLFLRSFNAWYYGLGKKLPPGDLGWPIVGHSQELLTDFTGGRPNEFINKRIAKYGKLSTYTSHLFGKPAIILPTIDSIKFALADEELFKFGIPNAKEIMGKESKNFLSGAPQKRFRHIMMEALGGPQALTRAIPIMDRHTKQALEAACDSKKQVDFYELCKTIVQGSEMEIFVGPYSEEEYAMFHTVFRQFVKGIFAFPINLPGFKRYNSIQARLRFQRWLQAKMDHRRAKESEHSDALSYMMDTVDDKGQKLSDETIACNLFGLFLGSQSTFRALLWTTIYLSKHPQALDEMRQEHRSVAASKKPGESLTKGDTRNMPVTKKIFDETLRLLNIFPFLFRNAEVDVDYNGVTLPKGFMVIAWLRALHMDPDSFNDPEKFNPYRWDDPKTQKAPFLPFGTGIRGCPGSAQAYYQAFLFLYNLSLNYNWEFVEPDSPVNYIPEPKPANCFAIMTRAR